MNNLETVVSLALMAVITLVLIAIVLLPLAIIASPTVNQELDYITCAKTVTTIDQAKVCYAIKYPESERE